jgi:hypothetical protein
LVLLLPEDATSARATLKAGKNQPKKVKNEVKTDENKKKNRGS